LREAVLEVVHVDLFRMEALEALAPDVLGYEQSVLEQAVGVARGQEPAIVVEGVLREPPAAEALIEASEGAEMLVVGSRGLSGLTMLALGSVSGECVHRARCPVVIVRPSVGEALSGGAGSGTPKASEAFGARSEPR
jgi:nucleotide-binding universal stress UspA family protein